MMAQFDSRSALLHADPAAGRSPRMTGLLRFLSLPLICLTITGCASIQPSYVTPTGADNVLNQDSQYTLTAIEFGELGSYADPHTGELEKTLQLLKSTERPLLVVFIHGWLNNATSGNVGDFKGFLSRLAQSQQVVEHHYNVFGVYFAWPGKSLEVPYLEYLSFWNRKQAAERIASNGDCLDAITQLSQAARRHLPYAYVFLIGHSFGGLILERTVEHTLRTLQGQKNVKPPWDLALMLNPASDSVLTRQLVSDLQGLYTYSPDPVPGDILHFGGQFKPNSGGDPIPESQPTVVELQSDNDTATHDVFPIGTTAGIIADGHWDWNQVAVPRTHKLVSEREFYLSTPGNDTYLVNHEIVRSSETFSGNSDALDYNLDHNPVNGLFFTTAPEDSETIANAGKKSGKANAAPVTKPQAWKIDFVTGHDKYMGIHVPFWIVRVPAEIIDNHGGIWSDNNMALMAAIFRMHRPILPNNTIVPAKSYVLPSSPDVKSPSH